MKTIRIRAKIQCFTPDKCLLRQVENLSGTAGFNRTHLWVGNRLLKRFPVGSIIEFTGEIYHYGAARPRKGIGKIRNIQLIKER